MRQVILVVDDEPCVLRFVCTVLSNAGFLVLAAASPQEALEIGSRTRGRVDLMLSDVVMPGLSGPALADRFLSIHAETECMFMAGLPDSPEIFERIVRPGRPFLPKPFVPRTLVSKVQEVLRCASAGPLAAA